MNLPRDNECVRTSTLLDAGKSMRSVANLLNVDPTTVSHFWIT